MRTWPGPGAGTSRSIAVKGPFAFVTCIALIFAMAVLEVVWGWVRYMDRRRRVSRSNWRRARQAGIQSDMRILAISGSLRTQSSNTTLLRAAARLAPADVEIVMYEGLGELPHFNPDHDGEGAKAPHAVRDLRERVEAADAVMICSPEYAHGVPGSMKNALDWLVSTTALSDKPIALVNASPRSRFANAQLAETLRTMAATVLGDASVDVPLSGKRLDEAAMLVDASIAEPVRASIAALARAVATARTTP